MWSNADVMELDASANGEDVSLRVGETFQLSLAETPTTGYRWTVIFSGEPVLEVLQDQRGPAAGGAGGAGSHLWVLRARQAGEASLELHKLRPWESSQAPAETFTLRVTAE